MRAVAAQNPRVKDPVYHVVLSWPAGESPSDEQAFACGRHAMQCVGLAGHQYVFAVHRDTGNVHAHLAVNRVHPTSYRAVYPDRDYFKLDRAMRELELRFGWRHDKGPYAVFERDGMPVIDWASTAPDTKGHVPTPAADMERHADRESFFSYVRGAPRQAVIEALKSPQLSWVKLHGLLSQFGLALREKGQGFAIHELPYPDGEESGVVLKASDMHEEMAKGRLVKRLGPFETSDDTPAPAQRYDKFRPPVRDQAQRDLRRQERADARRQLQERYAAYRAEMAQAEPGMDWKAAFAGLRDDARRRRAAVRYSVTNRGERKAQLSIIAFETARERQRLRAQARLDQNAVRARRGWTQGYKEWVGRQAAAGDAAAISQLRGWSHASTRRVRREASVAGTLFNALHLRAPAGPLAPLNLEGLTFRVRRDGTVCYRSGDGGGSVLERDGVIEVEVASDLRCTVAALLIATKRCGDQFDCTGEEAFVRTMHILRRDFPNEHLLFDEWRRLSFDAAQTSTESQRQGFTPSRRRVER
jgi:hypothetical protein